MKKFLMCLFVFLSAPFAQAGDYLGSFYFGGDYIWSLNKVKNVGASQAFQVGTRLGPVRLEGEFMRANVEPNADKNTPVGQLVLDSLTPAQIDAVLFNSTKEFDSKRYFVNVYVDKKVFMRLNAYVGMGVGRSSDTAVFDFAKLKKTVPNAAPGEAINIGNRVVSSDQQSSWAYQILGGADLKLFGGLSVGPKFRFVDNFTGFTDGLFDGLLSAVSGSTFGYNVPANWSTSINVKIRPGRFFH